MDSVPQNVHLSCCFLLFPFFPAHLFLFHNNMDIGQLENPFKSKKNTVQRHLQTHTRLVIMMMNNHLQLYQSRRKVPGLPTRSRMRFTRPRTRLIVTTITMTNKQRIMNSTIARSKTKTKSCYLIWDNKNV